MTSSRIARALVLVLVLVSMVSVQCVRLKSAEDFDILEEYRKDENFRELQGANSETRTMATDMSSNISEDPVQDALAIEEGAEDPTYVPPAINSGEVDDFLQSEKALVDNQLMSGMAAQQQQQQQMPQQQMQQQQMQQQQQGQLQPQQQGQGEGFMPPNFQVLGTAFAGTPTPLEDGPPVKLPAPQAFIPPPPAPAANQFAGTATPVETDDKAGSSVGSQLSFGQNQIPQTPQAVPLNPLAQTNPAVASVSQSADPISFTPNKDIEKIINKLDYDQLHSTDSFSLQNAAKQSTTFLQIDN